MEIRKRKKRELIDILVRMGFSAELGKAGADFKRQFDKESYRAFFRDMGYEDVSYRVIDGRMPCMIAVIRKQ